MRLSHTSVAAALLLLAGLAACASHEPQFTPTPLDHEAAPSRPSYDPEPSAGPAHAPPEVAQRLVTPPVPAPTAPVDPRLLPEGDGLPARSPNRYAVRLETTKGVVLIDVTRAWAPHGADRFYDLVRRGAYDDNAFFRAVTSFMVQVGIPGDSRVSAAWRGKFIPDDPPIEHNTRGSVTFATSGANQRVNQFFVNLVDNSRLDPMGFAPFGRVRDMTTVDALYTGYGETPTQARIQREGNTYLHADFPALDYLRTARIEP